MTYINNNLASVELNQINLPDNLAVLGRGMLKNNALLSKTLQADVNRWYPWSFVTEKKDLPSAFIGWGQKQSFKRATKSSQHLKIPAYSIEDGFLRSIDSGIYSRHAVSMVIDDLGIYFDLKKESRLEQMLLYRVYQQWTEAHQKQAQRLIAKICDYDLSKYNHTLDCPKLDTLSTSKTTNDSYHVLLIDQVAGDASIAGAGADKSQFAKMLKDAYQQHPKAQIWIKTHPASQKGYLSAISLSKAQKKRVQIISQTVNPIKLLKQVDCVYTVSSHMGFEALMLGKRVHCYGMSWYAGWGLTNDTGVPKKLLKRVQKRRKSLQKPQNSVIVEQLFFAAYLDYSHYVDPATAMPCNIDTAMDWLMTNRDLHQKFFGALTIYEFSRWKIPFVRQFLQSAGVSLKVKLKTRLNILTPKKLASDTPTLVWGLAKKRLIQTNFPKQVIYCMEDGFIRSNGLGASLLAPLSVVIDKQGIYYDATQTSDLETYLQQSNELTQEQGLRVQQLHHRLLASKVSKYNVGKSIKSKIPSWIHDIKATAQHKVLIVGQVEDDLSIKNCAAKVCNNTDLIKRVRQDNPTAFLIYKPHPDVEAGLRIGKVDKSILKLVNAVAIDVSMPDCLELIDTVHTISSLTGFEALLRDKQVVCYGLPFYAGWGLTTDADAHLAIQQPHINRRQRTNPLSLQQLIYHTLVQYPLYRLPNGYGLAQPEQVIDYLYNNLHTPPEKKDKYALFMAKKMMKSSKLRVMQARNLIRYNKNK